jgi:hypothetical protein
VVYLIRRGRHATRVIWTCNHLPSQINVSVVRPHIRKRRWKKRACFGSLYMATKIHSTVAFSFFAHHQSLRTLIRFNYHDPNEQQNRSKLIKILTRVGHTKNVPTYQWQIYCKRCSSGVLWVSVTESVQYDRMTLVRGGPYGVHCSETHHAGHGRAWPVSLHVAEK